MDNNKAIVNRIAKLLKMSQPLIHKVITKFRKKLFGKKNRSKKKPNGTTNDRDRPTPIQMPTYKLSSLEICTLKSDLLNCKPPHVVRTFKHCCDNFRHKIQPTELIKNLIENGVTWQRIIHRVNKRSRLILNEHEMARIKCMQYVRQMQTYRNAGKPIIYINELNPLSSDETAKALIVAAATADGPIDSVYMKKLTIRNFLKWILNRILGKLEEPAIIVMNASTVFRSDKIFPIPIENDSRQSIIAWLRSHRIDYDVDMFKPELFELIRLNEHRAQELSIETKLKEKGHQLMYIPIDQADLDPFELIWTTVKIKMMACDSKSFNMNKEFMTIESDVWKEHFDRIIDVENKYIEIEKNFDRTNTLYQLDCDTSSLLNHNNNSNNR